MAVVASHPIQYQSPLWRGLAREGLDVHVLYLSDHGASGSTDREFDRPVQWDSDLLSGFRHRFLRTLVPARPGSALTGVAPGLLPAIIKGRFDAVLISGYAMVGYLAAALAARAVHVPVYFRGETVTRATSLASGRRGAHVPGRDALLRAWFRSYAGAFPIGRESERFFVDLGIDPGRLTMTHYGVDNAWFQRRPIDEITKVRAELGCDPDDRLVMHAGKLVDRKRPQQAVATARALRRRGVPARAVIVGSGPLEQTIRAMLDPVDIFLGFANQSEIPALYAAADAVVVASTYESWGLVVNEALAAGTPVVASPTVPGAVEMAAADAGGPVRVVGDLSADAWATSCESLFAVPREQVAADAMALVAPYDVSCAAAAMAGRVKADVARRQVHP